MEIFIAIALFLVAVIILTTLMTLEDFYDNTGGIGL
jgi:hypothetical protein